MSQLNIFGYSPIYEAAKIILKAYQDHELCETGFDNMYDPSFYWWFCHDNGIIITGDTGASLNDNPNILTPNTIKIIWNKREVMWGNQHEVFAFDHQDIEWFEKVRDVYNGLSQQTKDKADKRINYRKGYIYLLRAIAPHNYYKIGLSKDPATRIESMGVKLPFPIEPIHTFPTNDMYRTEKALHEKYADKRVNGEWFELSPEDVAGICAITEVQS